MNLRFLINRRQVDSLPLLPVSGIERTLRPARKPTGTDLEERLERLLTPSELDMVEHRRPVGDEAFG